MQLNKRLITISVMLAAVMEVIDSTIANVAMPHMQASLGATATEGSWILTSYVVSAAIMTPATSFLTSMFGIRKVLLYAISLFTLSSVACGIANSVATMVLARLCQGVFGSCLIPLSQYIIMTINTKEEQPKAMAIWGMGIMVAPILGPLLGGYITEHYNWRFIFLINLPIGLLTLLGVSKSIPDWKSDQKVNFDTKGFVLFSLFIGFLQIFLDLGEQKDWLESDVIKICLLMSIASIVISILYSRGKKDSFLNIELFKNKNFAIGSVIMFFIGIILFSSVSLIPIFLQNLAGYNTIQSGILISPRGLGTMLGMIITAKITGKIDARLQVIIGLLLCGFSMYEMSNVTADVSRFTASSTGVIQGLGLGLIFIPISSISVSTVAPNFIQYATSMTTLIRSIGGAVGIAMAVFILTDSTKKNMFFLSEKVTKSSKQIIFDKKSPQLKKAYIFASLSKEAQTAGFINTFRAISLMSVVIIPLIFFMDSGKDSKIDTSQLH